jgi:hypothetical protein
MIALPEIEREGYQKRNDDVQDKEQDNKGISFHSSGLSL